MTVGSIVSDINMIAARK